MPKAFTSLNRARPRAIGTVLGAVVLSGLYANPGVGQATIPEVATDDQAVVLKASDLGSVLSRLLDEQISSQRLLEGRDVFSVTMLNRTAPTATIHGTLSDLYVIQDGSATLVTGGSLVDPRPASRPGDQQGRSIRGGAAQIVREGDVVFIPPGVVHGFRDLGDSRSITYLNIHFPWRE